MAENPANYSSNRYLRMAEIHNNRAMDVTRGGSSFHNLASGYSGLSLGDQGGVGRRLGTGALGWDNAQGMGRNNLLGEGLGFSSQVPRVLSTAKDVRPDDLVERRVVRHTAPLPYDFTNIVASIFGWLRSCVTDNKVRSPDIKFLYQSIHSCGVVRSALETQAVVTQIPSDLESRAGCRLDHYYRSLCELGHHYFPLLAKTYRGGETFTYTLNYTMFSSNDPLVLNKAGSANYRAEVTLVLLSNTPPPRKHITWIDHITLPNRVFNSKYNDVCSDGSQKLEDISTAFGFPRDLTSSMASGSIANLRSLMRAGINADLTTRFVVLWLMVMRLWHTGDADSTLTLEVDRQTIIYRKFQLDGVISMLTCAAGETLLNCVSMTDKESVIMWRTLRGYKWGDFKLRQVDLTLGGFIVPPEFLTKVHLMAEAEPALASVAVTGKDIYNAGVKYARRMHACNEMERAYTLAGLLVHATDLPSFSLPRPQGYLDAVGTALTSDKSGFIPPGDLNPASLLGQLVVTRQQLLLLSDIYYHSLDADSNPQNPATGSPMLVRQGLYALYAANRFSDAFGVSALCDPLFCTNQDEVARVMRIPFTSLAWTAINNGVLLKNSLSEYFFKGRWAKIDDIGSLLSKDEGKVMSTYLANCLLLNHTHQGHKVRSYEGINQVARGLDIDVGQVHTKFMGFGFEPCRGEFPTGFRDMNLPPLTEKEMKLRQAALWGLPESYEPKVVHERLDESSSSDEMEIPMIDSLAMAFHRYISNGSFCRANSYATSMVHVLKRFVVKGEGVRCALMTGLMMNGAVGANNKTCWRVAASVILHMFSSLGKDWAPPQGLQRAQMRFLLAQVEDRGYARDYCVVTAFETYNTSNSLFSDLLELFCSVKFKVYVGSCELRDFKGNDKKMKTDEVENVLLYARYANFDRLSELEVVMSGKARKLNKPEFPDNVVARLRTILNTDCAKCPL